MLKSQNIDRKLHLAIFLDYGGIESQIRALAIEYASRGLTSEVEFWSIGYGGYTSNEISKLGFKVVEFNASVRIPNFILIHKLIKAIRDAKFGIIYTHGSEANFHGVISAKIARVPIIICEEIGIAKHSTIARYVFRSIFGLATTVIAGSQAMKRNIVLLKEAKPSKIEVLYVPIESKNTNMKVLNNDREETKFVLLARLEEVKNIPLLIESLDLLKTQYSQDKWRLDIYGSGSMISAILHQIENLKLEKHIILKGPTNNPKQILIDYDFYVQSSFSEGFGISMVEAMETGLPPITTAVGVAPEIIVNLENGFLVQSMNSKVFASHLAQACLLSQKEYIDMSERAIATVKNRFSSRHYIDQLNRIEQNHVK